MYCERTNYNEFFQFVGRNSETVRTDLTSLTPWLSGVLAGLRPQQNSRSIYSIPLRLASHSRKTEYATRGRVGYLPVNKGPTHGSLRRNVAGRDERRPSAQLSSAAQPASVIWGCG